MRSRMKSQRNRRCLHAAVGTASLLALASAVSGATWYVKPGGAGNGTSWTNAFGNPQQALGAASANDVIWVAAGTYKPTSSTTDQTATFALKPDVKVYGGFAGTETSNQIHLRNPLANLTRLSGDIDGNATLDAANSHHVVSAIWSSGNAIDNDTQLDGFVIEMGYADVGNGGGIFIESTSPVIQNCVFLTNHSSAGGGAYILGTQMFPPPPDPEPIFRSCRFVGNTASTAGGGMAIASRADVELVNCVFSSNSASVSGGGMKLDHADADMVATNCTFWNNQSGSGGGINAVGTIATRDVRNCILWENTNGHIVATTVTVSDSNNGAFDPLFVDDDGADNTAGTLDDNLRLQCTSSSIDAGDQGWTPGDFFDVDDDGVLSLEKTPTADRRPRVLQADVDQGAYETKASTCPSDVDGNCQVDVDDLIAVILDWGPCGPPSQSCPADVDSCNGDGDVNVDDLIAVILDWGACPEPCTPTGTGAGADPESYQDCADLCSEYEGERWQECMSACFWHLCHEKGLTEFCDD